MNKLCVFIMLLLISSLANARSGTLQDSIEKEYGSCYTDLVSNLNSCNPSSCTYPDLRDSKAWKAITIIGMVDKQCYITYYSYIGSKITSDPDHCFYTRDQMSSLASSYRKLFKVNSSIVIANLRDKINKITYNNCQKMASK